MTPEEADLKLRGKLAELFQTMSEAADAGVDVGYVWGEIMRSMIVQAEAAGAEIPPMLKMIFS